MILQILNIQFKELKRFPQLQKLIDDFVGKRLGNELEKEKDKSLEVILFYEKYIQYLIRKDICIWDIVHDRHPIRGIYKRYTPYYSLKSGIGSIDEICDKERKCGEYYRDEHLANIWDFVFTLNYGYRINSLYEDTDKFIIIDIYCSYMSLFDKNVNRYGKRVERKFSYYKGNVYDGERKISYTNGYHYLYDKYIIECKCNICN